MQSDADGPGLGENLRIIHGRFVLNRVGTGHAIALDHVKRVTVKVPRHVEPCFVIDVADVDNQRVAVPAAARIAHPRIEIGGVMAAVCVDQAINQRPLEGDCHGLGRLKDLKREVHIHDPWDAGHVALRERIGLLPVLKVLGLLRSGPRLVWDFAAGDNRTAGRHVESGGVILEIGCRGAGCLPNAFEVRLAVGGARQRLLGSRRALRSGDQRARQGDRCDHGEMVRLHTGGILGSRLAEIS